MPVDATTNVLAPYVGAGGHPRQGSAVFDRNTGYFRSPRRQGDGPEPDRSYDFNSLGFRGTEYDPGAALRVFVCGCSYTFGMGVDLDRTWPAVFTRLAAAALRVPVDNTHVQNFSQIGASNNYVARTLIKQCHLAPPSLAIAAFTHNNRVEYLDGQEIRNLGYWNIRPDSQLRERPDSPGQLFFRQYSDRAGLRNLLTNMLFFQSAMSRRGVPYIILWIDVEGLQTAEATSGPVLSDYSALIDHTRISRLSIKQPGIRVDTADGHPGPQSHERFANALAREFGDRLVARQLSGHPDRYGAPVVLGEGRLKRASADRLARSAVRAVARQRPGAMRLVFGDNLAIEHFAGEHPIEIDLERQAWTIAHARLRAAYTEFVTSDLLRFNFWLNLLTVQEFMLACGSRLEISVPEHWFITRGQGNPVLDQLSDLLDRESVSVLPARGVQGRPGSIAARLARAKLGLKSSRIQALLRRLDGRSHRLRSEDPNVYPLW